VIISDLLLLLSVLLLCCLLVHLLHLWLLLFLLLLCLFLLLEETTTNLESLERLKSHLRPDLLDHLSSSLFNIQMLIVKLMQLQLLKQLLLL